MDFRFVAYDPQTGAKLYQLPRANSVNIGDTFGTRGTLELTYSAKAVNARDLPTFLEVQAEVTFDEGHNWAPAGPSLLRLSGEHEDTDQAGMRTLRFVGREWVLGKARVGNGDLELIDGKRPFYRASPGQILRTLILEAQDRGAADGIEIGDFTAAKDSSGNAWAKVATIYYSPGLPIGSVLENLVEQGMCDYRMNGRTIELFNPETTMGRDLTTGDNPVRVHGAVTEAPVKYTLEDLANSALLMGDEGFELEVDNPTAPDDYGRLEVTIEQGGVSDSGTARLMVDEALQRGSREVREITRSQSAAGAAFLPLRDYRVGDYVQVHTGGAWERYRVREIQLARDGDEWTIHTVINDRLQELLLKLAKRTNGIVNGSKGSGGDGTRPTPPEKPGIEPAAPEGLVIDQQVYLDRQGVARGQITAGWGSVTESTKGTAVEIGGYELWWRRNETQAVWTRAAVTDGSITVSHSPVVLTDAFGTAMEYQWRVRAIAEASTRPGPFSDVVTLTMTQDTEPPNTPSTPTVTTDLRIVTVDVDGLDEFGEAMPVDFDHTRIYFAAAEDMADAERVGSLTQPGMWNSGSMDPDVPVWVAVSAVDHVGNESPMTPAQSVTPRKLVDDDSIRDELGTIDDKINDAVDDLNEAIDNIVIDDAGIATYWMPTEPDETTEPPPKTGFLWFDTSDGSKLYRFDGQKWVSAADERIQAVQDAQERFGQDITEAEQRAIDEARDLADQARTAASVDATSKANSARDEAIADAEAKDAGLKGEIDSVIDGAVSDLSSEIATVRTSVDGKNRITQSISTPPKQYDGAVGDRWERMSSMGSGGRLVSNWRWNGTVWVSTLIGDAVLGNVDASKIGTGYLEADRIESGTITADKILVGAGRNIIPWAQVLAGETVRPHFNWGYYGEGTLECAPADADRGVPGHAVHHRTTDDPDTDRYIIKLNPDVWTGGNTDKFAVAGGTWSLSVRGYTDIANLDARLRLIWYKADGAWGGASTSAPVRLGPQPKRLEVTLELPDDAAYMVAGIRTNQPGETHWVNPELALAVGGTLIEDGAITTGKLLAEAVTAGKIATGAIEAVHIQAGAIQTDGLAANAITAEKIAAEAIEAEKIKAGAVGAVAIAAGAIEAKHITTSKLLADAVLVGGSVGATLIEDGAITTDKILAGAITAESGIIENIDAGTIKFGEMEGARLKAGTVTADKLLVGGEMNLIANPRFSAGLAGWTLSGGATFTEGPPPFVTVGANGATATSIEFGIESGAAYTFKIIGALSSFGFLFTAVGTTSTGANETQYLARTAEGTDAATGQPIYTASFTPPASWVAMRLQFERSGTIGSANTVYGVAVFRQVGSTLIQDGAITTDKILANAITAGKIAALAIEADHISANAITADKINAGAIDGKLITGARIRTAATGRRTELDVEGLKSYDSSGNTVLTTQTSDGSIDMRGNLRRVVDGVEVSVGDVYSGVNPGIRWEPLNKYYAYNPGIVYSEDAGKDALFLQGPGSSAGYSYLSLRENGESFAISAVSGNGSWGVQSDAAGGYMSVGSTDGSAPYMSLRKGAGTTGQAWFGYNHPTNDGYATLALRDRYIWLGAYDSNGNVVSRLYGDADSTELTAGTRNMSLRGKTIYLSPTGGLSLNPGDKLYAPGLRRVSSAEHMGRDGDVVLISSSRKYKLIEEPIETTVEDFEDKLLSVDAKTWVDKSRAEMVADSLTEIQNGEEPEEYPAGMGGLERIPGVVAEDMVDAGLDLFVHFEDGEPESVLYDRIGPALIPIIRRLRDRVDALETKLGENNAA